LGDGHNSGVKSHNTEFPHNFFSQTTSKFGLTPSKELPTSLF
jgi:hypothetical protein